MVVACRSLKVEGMSGTGFRFRSLKEEFTVAALRRWYRDGERVTSTGGVLDLREVVLAAL